MFVCDYFHKTYVTANVKLCTAVALHCQPTLTVVRTYIRTYVRLCVCLCSSACMFTNTVLYD